MFIGPVVYPNPSSLNPPGVQCGASYSSTFLRPHWFGPDLLPELQNFNLVWPARNALRGRPAVSSNALVRDEPRGVWHNPQHGMRVGVDTHSYSSLKPQFDRSRHCHLVLYRAFNHAIGLRVMRRRIFQNRVVPASVLDRFHDFHQCWFSISFQHNIGVSHVFNISNQPVHDIWISCSFSKYNMGCSESRPLVSHHYPLELAFPQFFVVHTYSGISWPHISRLAGSVWVLCASCCYADGAPLPKWNVGPAVALELLRAGRYRRAKWLHLHLPVLTLVFGALLCGFVDVFSPFSVFVVLLLVVVLS